MSGEKVLFLCYFPDNRIRNKKSEKKTDQSC